jgi:hypothetical protein
MTDTDVQTEAMRLQLFRRMSPQKRLAMAVGWSTSLRRMSRAAVRQEFTGLPEAGQRRMFAERWLGPDLAAKVYPDSRSHG